MGPSGISIILFFFSPFYLGIYLYLTHRNQQQAETQHKRFQTLERATASYGMRAKLDEKSILPLS